MLINFTQKRVDYLVNKMCSLPAGKLRDKYDAEFWRYLNYFKRQKTIAQIQLRMKGKRL